MGNDIRATRVANPRINRRDFVKSAGASLITGVGAASPASAQKGAERTLLKGRVVLSFDRGVGDFDKADVLIEGRKIAAVQPNISATATVIDAPHMIVLPDFIDTHHHCYQNRRGDSCAPCCSGEEVPRAVAMASDRISRRCRPPICSCMFGSSATGRAEILDRRQQSSELQTLAAESGHQAGRQ